MIRPLFYTLLATLIVFTSSAWSKDHPYSSEFVHKVHSLFIENGQLSQRKIDAYIARLRQKRSEVVGVDDGRLLRNGILLQKEQEKAQGKGRALDVQKTIRKLMKHEVYIALTKAMEDLDHMKRSGGVAVYDLAYSALDLENAVRIEGLGRTGIERLLSKIKIITTNWNVPFASPAQDEATNLWDASAGKYLSVADIETLKRQNVDLSKYSPKASTFWEDQGAIARVDVAAAAQGRTLEAYQDSNIQFPTDQEFVYDSVIYSDTKPKFKVYTVGRNGKKQEFKFKFGGELHTEPTVAALMMTMGFPADAVRYVRNFKVNLGGKSFNDFAREVEVFYLRGSRPYQEFKLENYIERMTTDSRGNTVLIFKNGSLEARPEKIERLGPWAFKDVSHDSFREVRGLMALQIFFDNSDVKELGNNRLLLKSEKNGQLKRYHIHSDLGFSLARYLWGLPEIYPSKVVASRTSSGVTMRYKSIQSNSMVGKLTFADVKWMTRMLAQLTRQQISAALELGGWPQCVKELYLEKMASRRNDLVHHFGLLGETTPSGPIRMLSVNQQLLEVGFDDHCDQKQIAADGFTEDFDFDMGKILHVVADSLAGMLTDTATAAINGQRKIVIAADRLQLNPFFVTEVILNPRREIERNPNPTSQHDLWIVKDHLEIGLRLGAGFGIYKDVVRSWGYTLAYPVRTQDEGRYKNNFLVNVLLPLNISRGNLPSSYVLQTSHYLESGQGVNIDNRLAVISPGLRLGFADKVYLWRSIIDRRDPARTVVYRDKATYAQTIAEAFVRLGPVKLPFMDDLHKWGSANGKGVIYNSTLSPQQYSSVLKAVANGDFSEIAHLEQSFALANKFDHRARTWNLLIVSGRSDRRMDQISLSGGADKQVIQYAVSKEKTDGIPLITSKETRRLQVEVYTNPGDTSNQFQVQLSAIGVDRNTTARELSEAYLNFINGLAPDRQKVINFTPELGYSANDNYGHLVATSDTIYYPQAIAKLLKMTEQDYWSAFASSTGLGARGVHALRTKVQRYLRMNLQGTRANRNNLKLGGLTQKEFYSIRASEKFLKKLSDVKKESNLADRVKKLATVLRYAAYAEGTSFYEPAILGAINIHVGADNLYSRNVITMPKFGAANLIEERPLVGEFGQARPTGLEYLVYTPITAHELYTMFDSWF